MSIDMHNHFYPRPYIERLKRETGIPRVEATPAGEYFVIFPEEMHPGQPQAAVAPLGRPFGPEYWDVGEKLAWMDRAGIDRIVMDGKIVLARLYPGEAGVGLRYWDVVNLVEIGDTLTGVARGWGVHRAVAVKAHNLQMGVGSPFLEPVRARADRCCYGLVPVSPTSCRIPRASLSGTQVLGD